MFCQVSFFSEKQRFITTFFYHAAHSNKFNCDNSDSPLVFNMDPRIEQSVMWIVLRYMYIKDDYEIDLENMDSYILLAYFVSILLFFLTDK